MTSSFKNIHMVLRLLIANYVWENISGIGTKMNEIHSFSSRRILSIRETGTYTFDVMHYSTVAKKVGT